MARKSSRGNPWHDQRGRFCSGPSRNDVLNWLEEHPSAYKDADKHLNGVDKRDESEIREWIAEHKTLNEDFERHFGFSQKTDEEYAQRTDERLGAAHYFVKPDGTYGLTRSNEVQEGMIVEYAPNWCGPGEEKYVHVVKELYTDGEGQTRALISTINTKLTLGSMQRVTIDMIQPASKEKVDNLSKKEMPWETDPKYRDNKNGKLLWLMDHPESKYNDPDFIGGIKRIEAMSDMGISAERRQQKFTELCKRFGFTEDEGRHFIYEGYLE